MEFTKECLKGILLFVLILYDMRRKRDAMRENLEKYGEVIAGSILLSLGIWLFFIFSTSHCPIGYIVFDSRIRMSSLCGNALNACVSKKGPVESSISNFL